MVYAARCWTHPSPLGPLQVAATDRGVCLVEWSDQAVNRRLLEAKGQVLEERVEEWSTLFDHYFAGDIAALLAVQVDFCLVKSQFRRDVLRRLGRLPVGTMTTYGELAAAVERPGAAQAVGGAVGANPVPIVVPCHRVVAADGSLGGFSGGLATKRALLAHEGFADLPGGWVKSRSRTRRTPQMVFDL